MSVFRRIWSFIRSPTGFVGRDLEGNRFYEYPATSNDSRRTRRIVKYQGKRDLLEYATDGKQLAAQWRAWLSHTRIQPPTLQDLQRDLERQRQIMHNAAIIEARDNEERRRLSEARSPSISEPVSSKSEDTHAPSVASASSSSAAPQKQFSPWVPQPDHYEPQSWTPRSSMRGQ